MRSFNDLYINSIHYLRENGKLPGYFIGGPTNMSLFKEDQAVIALLLIITKTPTQREITHRKVAPLQEVLQEIPTKLKGGILSRMILEGEELSAFVIHTGISEEKLSMFATAVLGRLAIEKNRKRGFGFLKFVTTKVAHDNVEKAREQAKKVTLADSEPIAPYMK